jgi:uncharacterized membrane protein YgcG
MTDQRKPTKKPRDESTDDTVTPILPAVIVPLTIEPDTSPATPSVPDSSDSGFSGGDSGGGGGSGEW